jgi:hypothetical protein
MIWSVFCDMYQCWCRSAYVAARRPARLTRCSAVRTPKGPGLSSPRAVFLCPDKRFGSSPTLVPLLKGCFLVIQSTTILFTDVVGSTELSQRLSPDAAEEVRRGHFSILRQTIAEAGGTEVKNLGDGLMVVFGSASAALACAVAMQQGVERDNRNHERSVGLRVGLSGGEVTREDDDYFGDPVVEAARLCATCRSWPLMSYGPWPAAATASRAGRSENSP